MSVIITKIVSVFTSIIMMILNFMGIATQPADPYARIETPEYYLGERKDVDVESIVQLYNSAFLKTVYDNEVPDGEQHIKLIEEIEGDGAIANVIKVATPAIDSALARNNFKTDWLPGSGTIKAEDVDFAYAYLTEDGRVFLTINLKEQTDGPDGNHTNGGPVSRGIGTLGNVEHAMQELGATIIEGRETISLEYTNAYIICELDPDTGKILLGTWHYDVNVSVSDARFKISAIAANIKNLSAKLEYAVVIGEYSK